MVLTVDEVVSASAWERMREEWDPLLRTSDEDDIFLTYDWLRRWWEAYGEGRRPLILTARESGELVGVAPLMVSSIGKLVKLRIVEFIGTGPSDRLGAFAKEGRGDVLRAIWGHLRQECRWDVLDLRDMRETASTYSSLREELPSAEVEASADPFIALTGTYDEYLKGLSGNFRHNLSRSWRRLQEDHSAEVRSLTAPEEMGEGFDILLALNALRWQGIGTSTLASPQMRAFLRAATQDLSKRRQAVFHILMASKQAISITMGFHYGRRYLYYLSGFNPEYHNYAPGRSLLARIVEESYGLGLTEVDLLRGGEDYKYKYNPQERRFMRLRTTGKGIKGSLTDLLTG